MDETLNDWIEGYKSESTRNTYRFGLRKFKKTLKIDNLGVYIKSNPNAEKDLQRFLLALKGKPPKTIRTYAGAVKTFLLEKELITDADWKKLKRKGWRPKKVKAITRDRIPTKPELKRIVNYADIKCRSLVLFLISSGARIGETLQLTETDFNFEANPPSVEILEIYTKGEMGGRRAYFSFEARDAILDWLTIKNKTKKRDGSGRYISERVWPFLKVTAGYMFGRACDKAGLGIRDERTNRRKYHIHSLRKFFRSKIGFSNPDYTHALMGHSDYLDAEYLRLDEEGEIGRAYLEVMGNVSIFEVENHDMKNTVEDLQQQLIEMRQTIHRLAGMDPYEIEDMIGWWQNLKQRKRDIEAMQDLAKDQAKYAEGKLELKPVKTEQKVIKEDELEGYLAEGWTYVNSLNNGSGKCIVARMEKA